MSDTTASFGIDTTVPTTARMYDFWLGGHDNFAADRAAALAVSEAAPEAPLLARENRKFLRRAVRYLAGGEGITQFLDIGKGLATQGNVHQIAQQVNPGARVVYVDNVQEGDPGRNAANARGDPPVVCRAGADRSRAGPGPLLASRRTRVR